MKTELEFIKGDIARVQSDAVVNAANKTLLRGGRSTGRQVRSCLRNAGVSVARNGVAEDHEGTFNQIEEIWRAPELLKKNQIKCGRWYVGKSGTFIFSMKVIPPVVYKICYSSYRGMPKR